MSSENPQNMEELLNSMEPMKPLRRGDVVEGVVMRSDHEGILLNVGHKAEGLVPPGEMRTMERDGLLPLNIGDEVVAVVVKNETSEGSILLSVDRAAGEKGWRILEKSLESDASLNGVIIGFNRGGAMVEVQGVQGFVPISQLVSVARERFQSYIETNDPRPDDQLIDQNSVNEDSVSDVSGGEVDQESDIGKELKLKVLEVNRVRNRAILSERRAVRAEMDKVKAELIKNLSEGQVCKGKVTGISNFGAFVDLGGADGLIHISELSWNPVKSPNEVVEVGQDVDVYVLKVDTENNKIALSLKRLQQEPWANVSDKHQVGDLVEAKVTKLADFGAFARVEDSVEGLIHISELTSKSINHPQDVVAEGDSVRLKILRIEPERRRIALSLKQAEEEEVGIVPDTEA
tara:strand:+ start:1022 stop:2233 length:1212 start_codon:yes stop_codon:yes gene_type:complete